MLTKRRIAGTCFTLLLLLTSVRVLAHTGHGNEFNQNSSSQTAGAIELDNITAERIGLKVESVTRQSLAFGIQVTGQIEASPSRSVEVTNPVGGTVVKLLVEPGDMVEVGQPLAVITSGELAELRTTALENSAERQGDVQQAEANLLLAQQSYERQQQSEDAGAILMTIVDNRTVLATANIYEKDLNQVSQGQRVRITILSLPDQIFEGRIIAIGSVVEGENRVVSVKAELDNADGVLKPGMFAGLEVLTDRTPEPVVAIPQTAIVEANGQPLVFIQNGNAFQPVEVTLGRQAGELVAVESGLFEGDRIVTQRANQLYALPLFHYADKQRETERPKCY